MTHKSCRHYRSPSIGGRLIAGHTTCERGVVYEDLLPTPEARGSGWVRRLPCIQLGSLPRIEGGLPCPHYLEKTLAEMFAEHEPLRRCALALEALTPDELREVRKTQATLNAWMEEKSKPIPGVPTLEITVEHVALICDCGVRTAIGRTSPIACVACGHTYAVRLSSAIGDLVLEKPAAR